MCASVSSGALFTLSSLPSDKTALISSSVLAKNRVLCVLLIASDLSFTQRGRDTRFFTFSDTARGCLSQQSPGERFLTLSSG